MAARAASSCIPAMRHDSYHKTTATGHPDSHRPKKVAVFHHGIQVDVPRHHEFDVDSSPMSSDPVASDDEGCWHQHLWTIVRKHMHHMLSLNALCRSLIFLV